MRSEILFRACIVAAALVSGCVGGSAPSSGDGARGSAATSQPAGSGRVSDAARTYDLGAIPTSSVKIGAHEFRVWLAQEFDTGRPGLVQEGLMHVPSGEIADDQGMLFVFGDERHRGFWMLNTIAALDIAYARMDGTIVSIHQMAPQTLRTYNSIEPAMFALEVKQGTFARLGIKEGDVVAFAGDVFEVRP